MYLFTVSSQYSAMINLSRSLDVTTIRQETGTRKQMSHTYVKNETCSAGPYVEIYLYRTMPLQMQHFHSFFPLIS